MIITMSSHNISLFHIAKVLKRRQIVEKKRTKSIEKLKITVQQK